MDIVASEITSLEDIANENGVRFWYAHQFAEYLGYKDFDSFLKVIRKATVTCDNIGISTRDEFVPAEVDGLHTYKLTRFACFLCVSHADEKKKPMIATAKAVLSKFADLAFQAYQHLERIDKRRKLSEDEKEMDAIAYKQGLPTHQFGYFKNSGYLGMYNMGLKKLKQHKNVVDGATFYDFMGRVELAANSLRAILTAENIKLNNITDANEMFQTAKSVGSEIRKMVIKNTGTEPENLPAERKIDSVKTEIKAVRTQMVNHDTSKNKINGKNGKNK